MADVAILGTGRMGAAMAFKVASAGHQVTLWNRTHATAVKVAASIPGGRATVASSPQDAVRGRDVVLSMLADGDVTCDVLLDSAMRPMFQRECVVCDHGTSGVAAALALAAGLNETGIQFLDAPVSGSVAAVEAGTLLVMAGGTAEAIEAAKLVLEAYARRIAHVGPAGSGQAMKLAVNLVVHDLNAALSEALVLAEKAGIARADAYGVLQDSVVGAPFVVYKRSAFLDPSTPVAMSLELVLKDLQLITEFADLHGSPAQVTRAARDQVATVCEAGNGDQDMAALSRLLER